MHRCTRQPARRPARLRIWPGAAGAVLVLAAVTGLMGVFRGTPAGAAPAAHGDDVTVSQNSLRTGWDAGEPGLSPAVLRSGRFRRLFRTRVSGQIFAQPLVVGRTVIVATENNWVYGLDAASGKVKWHRHLGRPFPASRDGCTDLAPHIGVTSTPVYDPGSGSVYVLAETAAPAFTLFGVNAQTGHLTRHIRIHGSAHNDRNIGFSAAGEFQRPGLLLMNGSVYAAFGSHCDQKPYVGFVAGVSISSRSVRLWSDETGLTDNQAGIWHGGGGVMSDRPGRLFVTSGNGVSPPPGKGTSPPGTLGDSVIQLAVGGNGELHSRDFFSPRDAPALDAADIDFGSGGPAGLPFGAAHFPQLLVQAGKDGRIFLLNRNHLGGRDRGSHGGDRDVSQAGPYGGQWGHPAVFGDTPVVTAHTSGGSHDYVYYLGRSDYLRVLKFRVSRGGRPVLTDVAHTSYTFGYTSGSPVITSAGTSTSSAVVWVIRSGGSSGAHGSLDAFRAVPSARCRRPCPLRTIWSEPLGRVSKFATPATSGGRVYVGTRSGWVFGFGAPGQAPLHGLAPIAFPQTRVGSVSSRLVTVTASAPVTVSRMAATADQSPDTFRVTRAVDRPANGPAAPARFPVTLAPGDVLRVRVLFAPAARGGATGTLRLTTRSPGLRSVDIPLSGVGTRTGLYPTLRTLHFAILPSSGEHPVSVPVGIAVPLTVDITNGGTGVQTVTAVTPPGGPFHASGLPARGTRLQPGQSVVVQVTYQPQRAGRDTGSFTISGNSGTSATVALTGTAVPPRSRMAASPAAVNFGAVRLGRRVTAIVTLTNAGNQPATFTGPARLAAPFGTPYPVARGLPLIPADNLRIPVTFRPRANGTVTGVYRLTWTDHLGTHTIAVPLTGRGR
jgi:hypothetical protein